MSINKMIEQLRGWADEFDAPDLPRSKRAYLNILDRLEQALDPGDPPEEGAIPLRGWWVTLRGDLSTVGVITPSGDLWALLSQNKAKSLGIEIPEPPIKVGEIVNYLESGGEAPQRVRVLGIDGEWAWVTTEGLNALFTTPVKTLARGYEDVD